MCQNGLIKVQTPKFNLKSMESLQAKKSKLPTCKSSSDAPQKYLILFICTFFFFTLQLCVSAYHLISQQNAFKFAVQI